MDVGYKNVGYKHSHNRMSIEYEKYKMKELGVKVRYVHKIMV